MPQLCDTAYITNVSTNTIADIHDGWYIVSNLIVGKSKHQNK